VEKPPSWQGDLASARESDLSWYPDSGPEGQLDARPIA
jgi:hypothetical protein